jgi:hypothetical protein
MARDAKIKEAEMMGVAPRQPLVKTKLFALDQALEQLEKSLIELDNRLTDVMSMEKPEPTNDVEMPHETCQMADNLQSHVRHVDYLIRRVGSITSRLEI